MTLKDLKRMMQSQQEAEQQNEKMEELKNKLQDLRQTETSLPFWIWGTQRHRERGSIYKHNTAGGRCCFNHVIGLPKKNGQEYPLFDYERVLYKSLMEDSYLNSLPCNLPSPKNLQEKAERNRMMQVQTFAEFKNKHVWIKKATGIGVTEFMLRFMIWLCLRNNDYQGSQMVIITGPNQELAIKLIKRMKAMFEPHGITFDSKETVIELNGCSIEAYPSNHIDAFRSLTNPKFILIDEADFFRPSEQEDVRHVAERYIAKSDPFIVMVSTPNRPLGLFQQIEQEPFDKCIYKKVYLDYTYGVGKIYTEKEIEKAKKSPSFPREYELQYQGLIGNVFSHNAIERCQKIQYNPNIIVPARVSIGIDPGFGSGKFAIVVTRFVNERIEVVIAEEHDRPHFNAMIDRVWEIKKQLGNNFFIYVDAANPEIWQSLKKEFNEQYSMSYVSERLAQCEKNNTDPNTFMRVIPVNFQKKGKAMLQHAKSLVEDPADLISIDKQFDKLLTSLRTAVANEYQLDKEVTSYHDILDAFRLSLQDYRRDK